MRVLVKSSTKHELLIDDDGMTPMGQYFTAIPDVLDDDTADEYEKTRTIVETMRGACPDATSSEYSVFVFDGNGALIFTGQM
jgi:hypothetical protein